VQLFAAAYLGHFDETDPRAHYLADAGTCTNVAAATGPALSYSFTAPAGARFVVEVESCGVGSGASLPYNLDVRAGAPAEVTSAAAVRRRGRVAIRWHTRRESGRIRFTVYREQLAIKLPLGAVSRSSDGTYALTDAAPPTAVPFRYWIHARAGNGDWSWYGPVVPGKS
jgi:hypothetical protein